LGTSRGRGVYQKRWQTVVGKIVLFRNEEEMALYVVQKTKHFCQKALFMRGRFNVAFSGGRSPVRVLKKLAEEEMSWKDVHIFQVDERYVSPESPLSNSKMLKETLLDRISIPEENIHFIETRLTIQEAAREYENLLRLYIREGFDLIILGLGSDCHIASLFPNSPLLKQQQRWVVEVIEHSVVPERITVTLPLLRRAGYIFLIITGEEKRDAFRRLTNETIVPNDCPGKYLYELQQTEVLVTADAYS
jgi:6-phosphogluconolactonase